MPRPARIQYENAFYHVMNRGRGRKWIFHGEAYYEAYLKTLEESYDRYDARIHAFCLMGNHYHLLIETPLGNLDRIMRHINGLYTQRYNRLKRSDGPLFRGRYKSILVDEDAYLLQVSRYIHRNPLEVKGASEDALSRHRWSSYQAYVNKVQAPKWLSRELTYRSLGWVNRYARYEQFVLEGNDIRTEEFYGADCLPGVFGDQEFRQTIYDEQDNHVVATDVSEVVECRPEMDEIIGKVADVFGVTVSDVGHKKRGRQVKNVPRQVAIYCCQRLSGGSQKEVAEKFSLTHRGSVSSAVRSIGGRLEIGDLKEAFMEIKSGLKLTKLS